ncbi:hypothetical protein ES708_12485 [subsurface metagenome]
MSLRTGVAVEDLSALAYAADISGSDIGTLEKGLKGLTKAMDDASFGIGEGMEAFEFLDIAVTDTEGNLRSTVDVLKEAATKISAIEDPTKQSALAMKLFGARAGPQLLPLLKMGEAGIDELMEEAKRLNITISTESAKAAADFTDAMTSLKGSLAGAGRMIGDTLIPALTPLIEKATEIVVKIQEWVEENADMVEGIVKWAAGLGIALAILGPIAIILPSLITGFTLLSGAFLPFLAGGLIIAGLIKINDLLEDIYWNAYRAEMSLDTISVEELDKDIDILARRIKELSQHINVLKENPLNLIFTGWQGSVEQLEAELRELEAKMGVLIQRRYELTGVVEKGIDVDEKRTKLDEEMAELLETIAQKEEQLRQELEAKTKAAELENAQAEITNKMYALTDTAIEAQIRALYALATKWQDAGVDMDWVAEYVEKATEAIYKQNEAIDENIGLMEEVAGATKAVEDRWFALTHLPYEVKIKEINEEYDKYIKLVEESTLSDLAKETAIRNATIVKDEEIEVIKKAIEAEKELATKEVTDRILELSNATAYSYQQIDEWADRMLAAGVVAEEVAKAVELMKKELEEPLDISPWEEFFKRLKDRFKDTFENTIQAGILNVLSTAQTALGDALFNILSGAKSFQESMGDLWKSIVDSIIMELARLAAFYVFKWIFAAAVPAAAPILAFHQFGGEVKKFQFGGGTDSVLAAVTPGEYIIDKPMTDFIKRFRMFPSNLIEAIAGGLPTPAPAAFATGGSVGTPNINRAGFGDTNINVYVSGNNISSELDVRRLAGTIGDEVLRKIEIRRRY